MKSENTGHNRKRMTVNLRHVATPDADQRLSRVLNILVKAARKAGAQSGDSVDAQKEEPPSQTTADDGLTAGAEGVPHE